MLISEIITLTGDMKLMISWNRHVTYDPYQGPYSNSTQCTTDSQLRLDITWTPGVMYFQDFQYIFGSF